MNQQYKILRLISKTRFFLLNSRICWIIKKAKKCLDESKRNPFKLDKPDEHCFGFLEERLAEIDDDSLKEFKKKNLEDELTKYKDFSTEVDALLSQYS
ncbi:hypothetical protein [Flavobacterium sp.]|uniref:hypothetical protein n=1 Tax=Flavobacterium sp. TaxID=239 RepID=UPI00286B5947|nr:hypothetical protein [Flavobacterium sp.]